MIGSLSGQLKFSEHSRLNDADYLQHQIKDISNGDLFLALRLDQNGLQQVVIPWFGVAVRKVFRVQEKMELTSTESGQLLADAPQLFPQILVVCLLGRWCAEFVLKVLSGHLLDVRGDRKVDDCFGTVGRT